MVSSKEALVLDLHLPLVSSFLWYPSFHYDLPIWYTRDCESLAMPVNCQTIDLIPKQRTRFSQAPELNHLEHEIPCCYNPKSSTLSNANDGT